MKKITLVAAVLFAAAAAVSGQTLEVGNFRHVGPFTITNPYQIDSVNVAGKKFDAEALLNADAPVPDMSAAETVSAVPAASGDALQVIGFSTQNTTFAKAEVKLSGFKKYRLYMDGKEIKDSKVSLEPGTHDFVVRYVETGDSLGVKVVPEKEGTVSLRNDGRHIYSLDINTIGIGCGGVSVSPDGKYMTLGYKNIKSDGKTETYTEIMTTADLKVIGRTKDHIEWMPEGSSWYLARTTPSGRDLVSVDASTYAETVIARNIPDGAFTVAPGGKYLVYATSQEGPKEGEVHQILVPDDRQPGWRDRTGLAVYDIASGYFHPLTFGYHNAWLSDVSSDGSKILFITSRERLTKRPTSLMSLYEMDLATLEVSALVEDDGFISNAQYSPDAKKVLITGSPEALGGVGKAVKEGQTPNSYDYQLFVMTIADRKVKPLTVKFNPSVQQVVWSKSDGQLYFTAEDKDLISLFRMNPDNGKAESLGSKEEYNYNFSVSDEGSVLVYYGQSLSTSHRAYVMDTKKKSSRLVHDFSAERLAGVDMGKGYAYEFKSRNGDTINGFYVLPSDFDPSKKYPLIVHYYGGCSPSSRYCIGSYSPQLYAAQGYVFYVINPSGASGFGQEFAARHVNTAGEGVAEDIIEGTKKFCEDHPFVDASHIGCFSASYGGFMTQLLLTKTDIYATGISHAGISDHTSYWGEGYWGYSYSETSMANSYPWTRKDLYVDRSPLFNAEKINSPLLFLHGSADTNVPIGESIQMFTALKLLGKETAFVVVDGENHHILDFDKNRQWLRTISAWFSKYLKEDSTWWDELYPEKNL